MADGAVSVVLGKLWDLALKEAALYEQVGDDMQLLRDKLEWLHSFLRKADQQRRADEDSQVGVWVRQTREMTFLMEDSLDEFLHGRYRAHWGHRTWRGFLSCAPPLVRDIWIRRGLGCRVQKINKRLTEISARKDEYKIVLGPSQGRPSWTSSQTTELAAWNRLEDNPVDFELGGMDGEPTGVRQEEQLKRLLLDANGTEPRLLVISLGGESGIGKTTLAHKLYNSVQMTNRFQVRAKVSLPPKLQIAGLLNRIYWKVEQQIPAEERKETMRTEEDISNKLKRLLEGKRFLIVLDGVVTVAHWNNLRDSLPDNDHRSSRVLLIPPAEGKDTVVFADKKVELRQLSRRKAMELFYGRVFGSVVFPDRILGSNKTEEGSGGSREHHRLSKKKKKKTTEEGTSNRTTLSKCDFEELIYLITGGVPLAIVLLAGLLRFKEFPSECLAVLQQLAKTATPRKRLDVLLSLSFDELPHRLKSCLLYFATMPEHTPIDADRLVRLWIAEGFVQQKKGKTKEEIGQSYLKELISCCLVQLLEKGPHGAVETIAVHDRVHAFLQSEAHDVSFTEIHHSADVLAPATVRRLALQNHSSYPVSLDYTFPKLRSLLCYFSEQAKDGPPRRRRTAKLWDCLLDWLRFFDLCAPADGVGNQLGPQTLKQLDRSNFLSVIDLEGLWLEELPRAIGSLIHLTYLGLRCHELKKLPRSLAKLRNLQTLDVTSSQVQTIHGAWKIQALRHVLGGQMLELPGSDVGALTHLYTLHVGCSTALLGRPESGSSTTPPRNGGGVGGTSTTAPRGNSGSGSTNTIALMSNGGGGSTSTIAPHNNGGSGRTLSGKLRTPLENMPYLRCLELGGIQSVHHNALTHALENREVLVSLHLKGNKLPMNLFAISGLRALEELKLDGELEAEVHGRFTVPNLVRLTLLGSLVSNQRFMKRLGELPSLAELTLRDDAFNGETLEISSGSFKSLTKLELRSLGGVVKCTAMDSAMDRLRYLAVTDCPNMTEFSGLRSAEELMGVVLDGVPKLTSFLGLQDQHLRDIREKGDKGKALPPEGLTGKIKLRF